MVKWIREWTADAEIGVQVQVQVRVSEKKSLDKYGLSVRSAAEVSGHIRDIQGGR